MEVLMLVGVVAVFAFVGYSVWSGKNPLHFFKSLFTKDEDKGDN